MRSDTSWRILRAGVGVAVIAAVAATGALGGAVAVAPKPTLSVAVLGSGSVASTPAGISCPRKCVATFAAGSRVLLTAKPKQGARFLRWGGSCAGTRTCRVKVSALSAVAAQFASGSVKAPPSPTSSIAPGSYTGQNSQNGNGIRFFVPTTGREVLNFSIPAVGLACGGGSGATERLWIVNTAIKSDGSFTATTSQSGLFGSTGAMARFTYSVTGRFQGVNAAGVATASGTYREDVVVTDTPTRSCTSNNQSWTVTRATQPPPTRLIQPGTYSGQNSQNGNGMTFFIPPGGTSVTNFTILAVGLACAGGGGATDRAVILQAAIRSDRSFTATATQDGVIRGAKAKLTYVVTGYFEGSTAAGEATAAGTYREDVVFADAPTRTCTSNNQSWVATRR